MKASWKIQKLLATIQAEVTATEAVHISRSQIEFSATSRASYSQLLICWQPTIKMCCDHYPSTCTTIRGVKECRDFLLRTGRYFNCLKLQHRVKDCESTKKCKHCRKKHHQSICDKVNTDKVQPPSEQPSSNETLTFETTANTSNSARSGKLVLLRTARAVAFNDDTGRLIPSVYCLIQGVKGLM